MLAGNESGTNHYMNESMHSKSSPMVKDAGANHYTQSMNS